MIHGKGLKFGIPIMRGIPRQAVHGNTPIKGTDRTARDVVLSLSPGASLLEESAHLAAHDGPVGDFPLPLDTGLRAHRAG